MSTSIRRRTFLGTVAAAAGSAVVRLGNAAGPRSSEPVSIIDTHQHLWDLERLELPWLANAPKVIARSFGIDDFYEAAEGLNVTKTVYMEVDVRPDQQSREAELVIELGKNPNNRLAGAVIGGSPDDHGFDEYLRRFAKESFVKGVRTVLHGARPTGHCLGSRFVDSMKRLGDAGLTFDLCLRPGEVRDGAELAKRCPQTSFVLDHCGNIGLEPDDSPVWRKWRDGIEAAAEQPNVVCKISGVIDKAGRTDWTARDLSPNVDECLDAFGEDRVLFGGDWPVCLIGGAYRGWVEALTEVVAERSPEFRRKLFHKNAERIYRLS